MFHCVDMFKVTFLFSDDFIALVGAFACSALSLIFPPIMDELINKEITRSKLIRVKNIGTS